MPQQKQAPESLSVSQRIFAAKLYTDGWTIPAIAKQFSLSRYCIWHWLNKDGVKMRPSGARRKFSDEEMRAKQAARRRAYREKNKEKLRKKERLRYSLDPDSKKKGREKSALRRNDPIKKDRINDLNWRSRLRCIYGLTVEAYEAMVVAHGGKCGICKTTKPGGIRKRWCIDHDHKTGAIRGLLCGPCNGALGIIGDNRTEVELWMREALAYLGRAECRDL